MPPNLTVSRQPGQYMRLHKRLKNSSPAMRTLTTRIQVGDWLEGYASALELDVWTSSTVTRASQDPKTKKWTVEIERVNAEICSFVVNHLVFAVGFGGGTHNVPQIPGEVCADTKYVIMSSNLSVRKNSRVRLCILVITRRPKTTRGKRWS
jgi:cation diffusion facilitator CzcD-associated flavoprotein CzcO